MKRWTYLDLKDVEAVKKGQIPNMCHNFFNTRKEAREAKKHYRPVKGWWKLYHMELNFTSKGS